MYGKFRCVVKSVKPEQQNQQDKVRLLQNFPQKVGLDTKKTKLSLIHIHINSEQCTVGKCTSSGRPVTFYPFY